MHRACTEKIGAQASPCLLQASAYALQASRLSPKMWRRHRHVCCRHLLMLCRHRACPQKLGRRHRHVCCRHLLLLCRHRACPKNCGAGIAMSAAGTCFCFAGIAFIWKNRAQAPHPVWGFKNLKEGRCWGEAVANASAVRIEGSI